MRRLHAQVETPEKRQSEYFRKGLQEDCEFIQLCLLLFAKSLPVKNIDILWHHNLLPHKVTFPNRLGTKDAIDSFSSIPLVTLQRTDPNPRFCNLVSDFGRKESVSCARSDVTAEERARRTRKPQIYICHAGLIDICVPIFADDEYLGCIFCGQVHIQDPSERGFEQVQKRVSDLEYIVLDELREAYFEVPVVNKRALDEMTSVLTIFADYLAKSWKRLETILDSEKRCQGELSLRQQEFSSLLLSGQRFDLREMEAEAGNLGFLQFPKQVLVVEVEFNREAAASPFHEDILHSRIQNLLSKLIEGRRNTLLTSLRRGEFVILLAPDYNRNPAHGQILVEELAKKILDQLSRRGFEQVRIGIGRERQSLRELVASYEEALAALTHDVDPRRPIRVFKHAVQGEGPTLADCLMLVLKSFQRGEVDDFKKAASSYLTCLRNKHEESPETLIYELAFFLDSLALAAKASGVPLSSLSSAGSNWFEDFTGAQSSQQLLTRARDILSGVLRETAEIFNQSKLQRKITLAKKYIDEHYAEPISLCDLAGHVGLSESYFSRQFRKATGLNFQNYLQRKRVCAATGFLLEPSNSITDCAFQVGFNDRAYFSKVFKEIVGVTPTQFANDPTGSLANLKLLEDCL